MTTASLRRRLARLLTGTGELRRVIVDDLPDLLWGSRCVGCARPGRLLCPACARALALPPREATPESAPPGLPAVWAASTYEGTVREVLLAHKERGKAPLAAPLGAALAEAVRAVLRNTQGSDAAVLVPVPSTRAAVRTRGYDPLDVIARRAARSLRRGGRPARLQRALRLTRTVADQAGLGAAERRANLSGAFDVRSSAVARMRGRAVVVVDDVVTTGATLHAVTVALREAGAEVVGAAVVAATPLRRPTGRRRVT